MLARVPRRTISVLLLFASCLAFVGCATKKEVVLVDDPDAKKESQIPWNKQEKWETQQSQFTGMTDHR
jgi:hypothetical protein